MIVQRVVGVVHPQEIKAAHSSVEKLKCYVSNK